MDLWAVHLVECVSELWPLKVFLSPHPLHFFFFFPLFRWDRGLDLRNAVSLGGIKLWKSFSSREQAFVIKIAQGTFHNGYFSSPFVGDRKGCFLALQCKKLVESLEVKTDESIQALIRLCVPRSFSLKLVRTQPWAIHPNYHLSVATSFGSSRFSTRILAMRIWICLFLQISVTEDLYFDFCI